MTAFSEIHNDFKKQLLSADQVAVGEWHSKKVDNPLLVTMEVMNAQFSTWVGPQMRLWQQDIEPNLPWAEDHFQERVSGQPLNPAPSHRWWPWNHSQHHDENEVFDHTYPERFWPKRAGKRFRSDGHPVEAHGIRFEYGDLGDVVKLLIKNPLTRQAYLPVFFPEDTGGHERMGGRIPCSMGYHFIVRKNFMHMYYPMRSCDFVRHFRDDVYMAGRLLQWMCDRVNEGRGTTYEYDEDHISPGMLTMHIVSLHAMEGDRPKMEGRV